MGVHMCSARSSVHAVYLEEGAIGHEDMGASITCGFGVTCDRGHFRTTTIMHTHQAQLTC